MNKPDSYLNKTKHYLAQLETDFDVRLQKVQEVEAFRSYPAVSSNAGWNERHLHGFLPPLQNEHCRFISLKNHL